MGLLSWFTSTPKIAETTAEAGKNVVDAVIAAGDKLFYTHEEKSQDSMQHKEKVMQFILDWGKTETDQNSERSKARRELAKGTYAVYFFAVLSALVLWKFDSAWGTYILKLMDESYFTVLVLMTAGFYYGPYYIEKIVSTVFSRIMLKRDGPTSSPGSD